MESDFLHIAGKKFSSRLILGTGKFASPEILSNCLKKAEIEIVTVALRRIDRTNRTQNILGAVDPKKYQLLINTSGARTALEAIRLAQLAQEAGLGNWIKIEVIPDQRHLFPDPIETLKATEVLAKENFVLFPYMHADPVLAKRLEEAGAATVMPLGSPIGSGGGLETKKYIQIIIEQSNVPVIVDAGIGSPSHAAEAMEMGADAVLVNTAIATAENPVLMTEAFAKAVQAGRMGRQAGIMVSQTASPSSPERGIPFTK